MKVKYNLNNYTCHSRCSCQLVGSGGEDLNSFNYRVVHVKQLNLGLSLSEKGIIRRLITIYEGKMKSSSLAYTDVKLGTSSRWVGIRTRAGVTSILV